MSEKQITIYRLLKYEGPKDWVESTLASSYIRPSLSKAMNPDSKPNVAAMGEITEIYVGQATL